MFRREELIEVWIDMSFRDVQLTLIKVNERLSRDCRGTYARFCFPDYCIFFDVASKDRVTDFANLSGGDSGGFAR